MKASILRRLGAYLIDIFLIFFVSSLLSGFMPNNDKITKLSNENMEFLSKYYEVIEKGDLEGLDEYSNQLNKYNYDLNKLSVFSNLFTVGLYFLYFIVFQRYNNGQTVGKKLLKIEVIDDDGNIPSFKQMIIRGIIIYPMILSLIDIILILLLKEVAYMSISNIIIYIQYGLYIVCFVTSIMNGKGLHNKLAGTCVINVGTFDEEDESSVTKWKKTSERERETKKYRVNHTSGKRKDDMNERTNRTRISKKK